MQPSTHPALARGFTALELIIVLVIGFSIIAMSANKMGDLFSASKITRATSSIMELATAVRSMQGANGYGTAGDITPHLISNGLIPKTLKSENNTIKNEWNGSVVVNVVNNGLGFSITYPDIPKSACAKLATTLLGSRVFSDLSIGPTTLNNSSTPQNILAGCVTAGGVQTVNFILTVDE